MVMFSFGLTFRATYLLRNNVHETKRSIKKKKEKKKIVE